eukprot:2584911-Prorocentrum_lima.AAC.1
MTSSLVGSEMCIRDRVWVMFNLAGQKRKLAEDTHGNMAENLLKRISSGSVSYTHLTLPTICSV